MTRVPFNIGSPGHDVKVTPVVVCRLVVIARPSGVVVGEALGNTPNMDNLVAEEVLVDALAKL